MTVAICRVEAAEIDEMQSFVGKKAAPRWLWHAIDHDSGEVMTYTLGRREDKVFLELKQLLEPFGISRFYTDKWGAYTRHLDPKTHQIGKILTQKIERKHLTLRTRIKRLARKSICFSLSILMHVALNPAKRGYRHRIIHQPIRIWHADLELINRFVTPPKEDTS